MRKPYNRSTKITGRDPVSQLYRAVLRYVEANGGDVLVLGGIQIQRWPGAGAHNFTVGIKCTGRIDEKATAARKEPK